MSAAVKNDLQNAMNKAKRETPELDAPGAGLPLPELLIARCMFGVSRWMKNHESWEQLFKTEQATILELADSVPEQHAATQVLIPRLRGMEDSSRFWSIYMVLGHLTTVNHAITLAIAALKTGRIPEGEASTADVKPDPNCSAQVVTEFQNVCSQFLQATNDKESLQTKVRYAHPWFGPLNAAGWHAMVAFHMRLHRKQIQQIIQTLSSTNG